MLKMVIGAQCEPLMTEEVIKPASKREEVIIFGLANT